VSSPRLRPVSMRMYAADGRQVSEAAFCKLRHLLPTPEPIG